MNNKRQAFVEEYLKDFNATRAAIRAGYSERTAYSQGQRLLKNVEVKTLISARLKEKQMGADEALTILAEHGRGDIGDFMDIHSMGFNLKLLDEDGNRKNTRVIKRIKQKTTTFIAKKESEEDREVHEIEIELYDAQAAADKVLRVEGKYKDNIDVTSGGKVIEWVYAEDKKD
jgi:phage terminase small subunit